MATNHYQTMRSLLTCQTIVHKGSILVARIPAVARILERFISFHSRRYQCLFITVCVCTVPCFSNKHSLRDLGITRGNLWSICGAALKHFHFLSINNSNVRALHSEISCPWQHSQSFHLHSFSSIQLRLSCYKSSALRHAGSIW